MEYHVEGGTPESRERGTTISRPYVGVPYLWPDGGLGNYSFWVSSNGNVAYVSGERMVQVKSLIAADHARPSHPYLFVDNAVDHVKLSLRDFSHTLHNVEWRESLHPDGLRRYLPPGGGPYCEFLHPDNLVFLDGLFPTPPDALLRELSREALRTFTTQMPTEVELPNFAFELRQLADLVPRLADSIAQTIASGYLTWSFGVAPFVGDLRRLAGLLGTVHARLQWLRDTWGKRTRLTFVRRDFFGAPVIPYYMDSDPFPFILRVERLGFQYTFRANAWLTHHLEDLDSMLTQLRAIAVATGFGSPAKAVWNAVPFSFILDWLLGVGSVLDGLSVTSIAEGDYWVRRPTISWICKGQLSVAQYCSLWPFLGAPFDKGSTTELGYADYRRYVRKAGFPSDPEWSDFISGFSGKQASLLLAIASSTSY